MIRNMLKLNISQWLTPRFTFWTQMTSWLRTLCTVYGYHRRRELNLIQSRYNCIYLESNHLFQRCLRQHIWTISFFKNLHKLMNMIGLYRNIQTMQAFNQFISIALNWNVQFSFVTDSDDFQLLDIASIQGQVTLALIVVTCWDLPRQWHDTHDFYCWIIIST